MTRANRSLLLCGLVLFGASVVPAEAQPTQELIQLTEFADELAFDIRESRQLIVDLCNASPYCRAYGEQVLAAVEAGGSNLRLGPVAVPRVDELWQQIDETDTAALFEFYRSPAGRQVVELEKASRTPAFLAELDRDGVEIYARQTDDRFALLESIDSMSDRSAVRRQLDGIAKRVVEWVANRAEADKVPQVATGAEAPDRSRHDYHQRLAFTYEAMSDEDLQLYVDFLESTAGETWSSVRRETRRAAVRTAAEPILARLVAELGSGESPPDP